MIDAATITILRAILDEICDGVSGQETGAEAHIASKTLEAAAKGDASPDNLNLSAAGFSSKRQLCGGSGR